MQEPTGVYILGMVLVWLVLVLIGVLITIAPLILWRNTNRTNWLLALIAEQVGVPPQRIANIYKNGGSSSQIDSLSQEQKDDPLEYFDKNWNLKDK